MILDSRPEYHRCIIFSEKGQSYATTTGNQRSSRMMSYVGANGLIALPARGEKKVLEAGEVVDVLFF